MSSATPYRNCHRPEPVREAVALSPQTRICCLPPPREFQSIRFDKACLDDVFVRQGGLIVMSNGRVRTQIPIGRRQK